MHQIENITHLYRARRYWFTPQLDQAMRKIIKHFGDRKNIPIKFMGEFINEVNRQTWSEGWCVFYEPCPVVKITSLEVIVISKDLSPEILESFPDFYAGGKFHVSKPKLQRDGKAYHSRHGEYFYIDAPEGAIALTEAKELLEV